ncbi:MAG: NYN domain-containing protein, partial [Thermoanaerobaculia bacterium]|nr:NYN domain-containing protein [Thermoanaerobaculia bacterium]
MRHVVDGSNLLGALGLARESDDTKRQLVRMLAAFARAEKSRVDCVFDGTRPDGFATSFGALSVKFSHPRSGDDVVEALVAAGGGAPCVVVTSDRALGARLRG